jgi:phospholipase C
VTGLWNYAQHFSMSDNSFGTTFGPSHVGAVNLVRGNNHGVVLSQPSPAIIDGTQVGNVEPTYDDCPQDPVNIHYAGQNIGDLLNQHGVSWGFFSDGFKPTSRLPDGTPVCDETSRFGVTDTVYDSGNEPFQYYQSTANQLHLPPTSVAAIGHQDQANQVHQYDLSDFWAAADVGNLPSVSFLKAGGYQGRCGYGPRLPFLIISPWAKSNHVDHTLTDQTSVIHFVEDNWLGGQRIGDGSYDALSGSLTGMFNFSRHARPAPRLFLNPNTGEPVNSRSG